MSPPFGSGAGAQSLAGEGVEGGGGPNSDEGKDTPLGIYELCACRYLRIRNVHRTHVWNGPENIDRWACRYP